MIKFLIYSAAVVFWSFDSFAVKPADFAKYYEIDLDEKLPSLEELEEKYIINESDYDRKYDSKRFIGNIFDSFFKKTITLYGSTEARIKTQNEEDLIDMLKMMPKEYYPYIGPYLHVAYGIPEKVKNMPGIKETKNKFPSRIAPQLADVEDIEFLSPALYVLLMPEVWPSNLREGEYFKMPKDNIYVEAKLPNDFMEKVHKVVPEQEFYPDNKPDNKVKLSDLRTIKPTKDSPLSGGDIKAFAKTVSKVADFAKKGENYERLISAGIYLNLYEEDQGKALMINSLKDIVNPCQRFVQKVNIAGLDTELAKVLAEDGFDAKGWAYTCDKSIKAYRKSRMSTHAMQSLLDFKGRVYESYMHQLLPVQKIEPQLATMQSVIEMYKSPQGDWMEMMKNYQLLRKEFESVDYMIGTEPLSF